MEAAVKQKRKLVKEYVAPIATIFLVDDDRSYLYPLGFYLQRNTMHRVYCYTTGEECLQNMFLAPDIIILDYNLTAGDAEKLDGLEVLRKIKAISPRTKVVMLSGRDSLQGATAALKLGAHSYVIKDLEALSTIKKIIDDLCNKHGRR